MSPLAPQDDVSVVLIASFASGEGIRDGFDLQGDHAQRTRRRRLGGDARIVTFANGTVAREVLVDCDDARQRLVYAVKSERVAQHSASVQVIADGEGHCRLMWIVDVLPNAIAGYMAAQMDEAAKAMRRAFPGRGS